LKLLSPQVDEFIIKSASEWCLEIIKSTSGWCLEIIKSTSEQVHYWVQKWTSSPHKNSLKLFKSTSGRVHLIGILEMIKSTSGRIHY